MTAAAPRIQPLGMQSNPLLGTLKREESLRIPAEASRAYLDAVLRGQGNGLTTTLAELGALDQPS